MIDDYLDSTSIELRISVIFQQILNCYSEKAATFDNCSYQNWYQQTGLDYWARQTSEWSHLAVYM